jgi:hypothetical protein
MRNSNIIMTLIKKESKISELTFKIRDPLIDNKRPRSLRSTASTITMLRDSTLNNKALRADSPWQVVS